MVTVQKATRAQFCIGNEETQREEEWLEEQEKMGRRSMLLSC